MPNFGRVGSRTVVSLGVMEVLAMVAVILRFTSTHLGGKSWGLDSLLLLFALAAFWAFMGLEIWGMISLRNKLSEHR